LIHHTYHIAQFEDKVGERISNFDFIFKFGGGYGSMCKLLHNPGFKGRYVLYDFPVFSALQEFFLKCHNISLCPVESLNKRQSGLSNIEWHDWHIEHIPNNNRYLVGKRKLS